MFLTLALKRRAAHVENFLPKIATFSQFQVYSSVTEAEQMTSYFLLILLIIIFVQ